MWRSTIQEEGQRRMLRKMLQKKFGPLPPEMVERLDELSGEKLEEVALAYTDAAPLAELNLTAPPAGGGAAPAGG